MKSYPEQLPHPLREGYGFEPVNKIKRTEMVSGRARQREMFDYVPTMATLSWLLDDLKARLLEAWADQVAKADWFTMKLRTPLGVQEHEIRFTTSLSGPKRVGDRYWSYSVTAELREKPLLEPGWAEIAPDYVLLADIFDLAMNVEWPESKYQTHMSVFDRAVNQEWPQ